MNLKVRYKKFLLAHFWQNLGKAFCLRAVNMLLGDKLGATSIMEVVFSFDKICE